MSTVQGNAVQAKLDEVKKLQGEADAVAVISTRVRLGMLLALVIFLGGYLWVCYQKYLDLSSEKNIETLTALARKKFTDPGEEKFYRDHLDSLVKDVQPKVQAVLSEHMKTESPKIIKKLEEQRDLLIENLPKALEKKLHDHFQTFVDSQEKILEEELPEVKDPKEREKIKQNLVLAMEPLLKRYYIESLDAEMKKLADTWGKITPADQPGENGKALADELYETLTTFMWTYIQEMVKQSDTK